ncbi:MAG: flagellar biosynthetic protein FliR [Blastomonas sp.]
MAIATLVVSVRIAPIFAFAPPFSMMRIPALIRIMLSLALAGWIVTSLPVAQIEEIAAPDRYIQTAMGEALIGLSIAMALSIAFAAILMTGRAIDIQAGFGLAMLIDPNTRAQNPLIGTIMAYGAALTFFAAGGAGELLVVTARTLETLPPGSAYWLWSPANLAAYLSSIFILTLALGGILLLTLFLVDLSVAFMSRTMPQMNVLLIGFQAKALATLMMLPLAIGLSGTIFLRIVRFALETLAART